ncbi:hypothetical protein BCR33DRAFT_719208, partial [Rhizoclosmatium globosum]
MAAAWQKIAELLAVAFGHGVGTGSVCVRASFPTPSESPLRPLQTLSDTLTTIYRGFWVQFPVRP